MGMKLRRKFAVPVVYVEWVDSCSDVGWTSPDNQQRPMGIRSVGLLVRETKEEIAQQVGPVP